jgi:6-phosphogluconolactonase
MHIFWGDERVVPLNDDRNNAKMAFDNLIDHVPIPARQVHIMRTDIEPADSANAYNLLLHQYFPAPEKSFDLVLLGLGEDAHCLSLFPGDDTLHEKFKWALPVYLPKQKMYRITLTPPVVNKASSVFFIVSGEEKSTALKHVLENEFEPDRYPAQIIRPLRGELTWLIDKAAASRLEENH